MYVAKRKRSWRTFHWRNSIIRFLDRCEPSGDCLVWLGNRLKSGYGIFIDKRVTHRAHRWIYAQVHGPIPKGLQIRHTCDNPRCVYIVHLAAGTSKDNAHDAVAHGRLHRKLSADDIRAIKFAVEHDKTTQRELARRYNVSESTISLIMSKKRWQHIEA